MKKQEKSDELHKIREQNYKETKNMTPKQYINHINKNANKLRGLIKKLQVINFPNLGNKSKKAS